VASERLAVTLSEEAVALLRRKVASGDYADESAVLADGLRALAENDAALETWLTDEVGPTWEAVKTDPGQLVSPEGAWDLLSAEIFKGP
jgi:antitoxin ParD1/3/4